MELRNRNDDSLLQNDSLFDFFSVESSGFAQRIVMGDNAIVRKYLSA